MRRHQRAAQKPQFSRRIHQKSLQALASHSFICTVNLERGQKIGVDTEKVQYVLVNQGWIRLQVIEDDDVDLITPENIEIPFDLLRIIRELTIAY